MIKLTKELREEIELSGGKIIEITLEDLAKAKPYQSTHTERENK